jgi:hypothetical protein
MQRNAIGCKASADAINPSSCAQLPKVSRERMVLVFFISVHFIKQELIMPVCAETKNGKAYPSFPDILRTVFINKVYAPTLSK